MQRGLKPIPKKDPRTYSFHRTFGAVSTLVIPQEFNFDQTGIFPDQNADGLPNACTAYATTGMASNTDHTNYDDKRFTYENTKKLMGVVGDVPCDIMEALKSATVYGVRHKGENEQSALTNRQAPYFYIERLNGSFFDGLVSAMWKKQGTLSVGSAWLPEFETVGPSGIIPPFVVPQNFSEGHNWECCGVKLIGGEPHIICKSWQGTHFGDKGYCYFSKSQIDALLDMSGSGAFGQVHATPEDIKTVQLSLFSAIIDFIKQIIRALQMKPNGGVPMVSLDNFCLAIRDYEGKPGDLNYQNNNPGNCRCSPIGYLPIYGKVQCVKTASGYFAKFPTYELGWLYLHNLVKSRIAKHPTWTIKDFFTNYSPSSDGNYPVQYAAYVAKRCGVTVDYKIKNLVI